MIKKAKTKRNFITILSAILGVVFAFITGFTYCAKSIELKYGVNPNSTVAYLANQQYHLVNDTIDNPIVFGEGSHNFEIALQYAFDYNFDVRLKYKMEWSVGVKQADNSYDKTATNVILHFANRDNIIYDENFIFVANSVTAGNGKLTFITGVDFVDPTDETYFGQTLRITIIDVKIFKQQDSYAKSSHLLTVEDADANTLGDNGVSSSVAAQAWIYYKNRTSSKNSYVMMYNHRRNYETGLPYSGLETAYKKVVDSSNKVTSYAWLGGEKAYAGTGMYVITGTESIKLKIKVAGIWRDSNNNDIDHNDKDASGNMIISENSIKYNYAEDWLHSAWDFTRLWETRTFDYVIPANSAYYIDIIDSVEIISAGRIATNLYDAYRLVTNSIIINEGLTTTDEEGATVELHTAFSYDESSANYIQLKPVYSNSGVSATKSYADKTSNGIEVVNKTIYSNSLYESSVLLTESQNFNTNINLINNTSSVKTVSITYQLKYTISNGSTDLTDETKDGEVVTAYTRAEEYIKNGTHEEDIDAFNDDLYYSYSLGSNNLDTSALATTKMKTSVTIDPYSSVNICEGYSVSAELRNEIKTAFGDYYDVWTYLIATPSVVTTQNTANLAIEKSINDSGLLELSVKNNTNSTVSGIQVNSLVVKELELEEDGYDLEQMANAPSDWEVNYWKYYTRSGSEGNYTYTQQTSMPTYAQNTYYKKNQEYLTVTPTTQDISNVSLKTGDSVVFARATLTATKQVNVSGFVTSSTVVNEQTAMLINAGDDSAYIVNTSTDTSYYIRFTGTYSGTDATHFEDVEVTESGKTITYNYYIGILRPGQILNVPMSATGDMTAADIVTTRYEKTIIDENGDEQTITTTDYDAQRLTDAGWDSSIVAKFTTLFTIK